MEDRVLEICRECSNDKIKAIKRVREEFNLGLVEAKELVDNSICKITGTQMPSKSGGFFAKRRENKEQNKLQAQLYADKHQDEKRYDLTVLTGLQYTNNSKYPTMWSKSDGTIYFDGDDTTIYKIIEFSWSGPQYKTITTSHTEGSEVGKTKRKGRFLGAAVGTVLLPGVGTVIGAAHGTGNKKSKTNSFSNTITTDHQSEVVSQGNIKLRNVDTDNEIVLSISCLSNLADKVSALVCEQPSAAKDTQYSGDPYEEVKKAKELFDMGIITQEEFNFKKKQLLDL